MTVETFLKQKLNNFILFLEKTIGTNNKLYPQVKQLQGNEQGLINYAEYIVKVAKINPETKKYYLEESTISEYLKNNAIEGDKEFLNTLRRYLELFINTLC